ncbi:MAG: glycosyltransferase family 2 protein [Rhodomicrobium sp.]
MSALEAPVILTRETKNVSRPKVSVGVPVYNGAAFLEKSLACLRDQTFRDIEILIFDNCSNDETGEIARRFCAADRRFRYHRQPINKGPALNFLEVLEKASARYFMWRAADDTSDLNYVECLYSLLLAHPDRDIAVPRIVSALPDGQVTQEHLVSPLIERGGAAGRFAQLFRSHQSWIYGLFRREAMIPIFKDVVREYPYVWGADFLSLFPLEFDRKVIGTNATAFRQYLRNPAPRRDKAQRASRDDEKIEMGRSFMAFAHRHVDHSIANPLERWFYHLAVAYYGHRRACSFTKRIRRRLVWSFGMADAPAKPA